VTAQDLPSLPKHGSRQAHTAAATFATARLDELANEIAAAQPNGVVNRPGFSGGGFLPSEGFQTVLL